LLDLARGRGTTLAHNRGSFLAWLAEFVRNGARQEQLHSPLVLSVFLASCVRLPLTIDWIDALLEDLVE
jgi:hypothetical protein